MAQQIFEAIKDLPSEWVVVILSALPISEVRGGIPAGIIMGLPLTQILPLAVISNVLSVLPIVLGFNWVAERLANKPVLGRLITRLIRRARSKEEMVNKHGVWAVTLFVAIPLPVTGAWTGAVAAVLFGIKFKHAFISIFIGVIIAGIIVTSLWMLAGFAFGSLDYAGLW